MSENPYCGIGPVPKNRTRGSMLECAMTKQVRFYGLHTVDKKTLQQARLKSTTKAYFNRLKTSVTNLKYDILAMKKKYKKMSNKTEKDALMKTMEKKNELFKTKRKELMDLEVAMGKTIVFKKKKPRESTPKPTPTKEPEPVPTPAATPKATTKTTKKKEQSENDDRIIKELRNYLIKNNIDATVEEILEKGYLKEYEKYNFVGEAVWEAMKHPCLKIGNNERMFTHPPKLRFYMDKDNYKDLKSKLKTIQQEINGAVFVLGLHPKECENLPERKQLFEDYQLLFTDEVKQLWKGIYNKLVIPKIMKEPKKETKSSSKQLSKKLETFINMLKDDLKKTDNMNKHGNKQTKVYRQFYEDMKNKYIEIIKNEFPKLEQLKAFYTDYCINNYEKNRKLDVTVCSSRNYDMFKWLTQLSQKEHAIDDFLHKYKNIGLQSLKLAYFLNKFMHIHSEGQYILLNSRINLYSLFSQALDKEYFPINKFLRDTHEYRKKKKA
jgi:hypothetical protein